MSGRRDRSDSSNVETMNGGWSLQHLPVRPLSFGVEQRPFGLLVLWLAIDLSTSGFGMVATPYPRSCQTCQCDNAQAISAAGARIQRWDDGSTQLECARIAEVLDAGPCFGFGMPQKSLADFEGMPYSDDESRTEVDRFFLRQMEYKFCLGMTRAASGRCSSAPSGARCGPNLR